MGFVMAAVLLLSDEVVQDYQQEHEGAHASAIVVDLELHWLG